MEILLWVIPYLPIFLSVLAFAIFLGKLKTVTKDGKGSLNTIGKVLLGVGLVGLIGSGAVTFIQQKETDDKIEREKNMAKQISELLTSNQDLKSANSKMLQLQSQYEADRLKRETELSVRVDGLIKRNKTLQIQNVELIALSKNLNEQVRAQIRKIQSLQTLNDKISRETEEITATSRRAEQESKKAAEIAEERAREEAKCRRIRQIYSHEPQTQAQFGC